MKSILKSELDKACKVNNLEVFTAEQLKDYATQAYNEITKSTEGHEQNMKQVADEIKSFTPFMVWDDETLEKSIMLVRPAQVIWDDDDPNNIEKARSGRYADTPENRKLGRVGQQYGGKKADEPSKEKESKEEETKGDTPNKSEETDYTGSKYQSGKEYSVTSGHPAAGDVLYRGDKFKISEDRKSVYIKAKGGSKWEKYSFGDIFTEYTKDNGGHDSQYKKDKDMSESLRGKKYDGTPSTRKETEKVWTGRKSSRVKDPVADREVVSNIIKTTKKIQTSMNKSRDDAFSAALNELGLSNRSEEALVAWEKFE